MLKMPFNKIHWIGNLGTLFHTALRCKKFYRIGPGVKVKVEGGKVNPLNKNSNSQISIIIKVKLFPTLYKPDSSE